MLITPALRSALRKKGVTTLHNSNFELPEKSVFESPCSFKWMNVEHSLELGAFSYAVSGYYFGAKIGRYTSIGEDVQIGRGSHPVGWGSTSPLFYQPHKFVLDQDIPQASAFSFRAPAQHAKATVIGNDCYIGHGAFISQGVTIGDGAVVGAHAVVTRDVPPYAVVVGNPARIAKLRFPANIIARMQQIEWWRYAFWDLSLIPVGDPTAFLDYVESAVRGGLQPYQPEKIDLSTFAKELE